MEQYILSSLNKDKLPVPTLRLPFSDGHNFTLAQGINVKRHHDENTNPLLNPDLAQFD